MKNNYHCTLKITKDDDAAICVSVDSLSIGNAIAECLIAIGRFELPVESLSRIVEDTIEANPDSFSDTPVDPFVENLFAAAFELRKAIERYRSGE